MRRVIFALLTLMASCPAQAQVGDQRDLVVRDRSGKVIERLEPGRFDTWVRRDRHGNYLGTAEVNRYGDVILHAPGGRVEGTVELAPGSRAPRTTR